MGQLVIKKEECICGAKHMIVLENCAGVCTVFKCKCGRNFTYERGLIRYRKRVTDEEYEARVEQVFKEMRKN